MTKALSLTSEFTLNLTKNEHFQADDSQCCLHKNTSNPSMRLHQLKNYYENGLRGIEVQGIKAVFIVYDWVGQCEGVLDFCMGLHTKSMIHTVATNT